MFRKCDVPLPLLFDAQRICAASHSAQLAQIDRSSLGWAADSLCSSRNFPRHFSKSIDFGYSPPALGHFPTFSLSHIPKITEEYTRATLRCDCRDRRSRIGYLSHCTPMCEHGSRECVCILLSCIFLIICLNVYLMNVSPPPASRGAPHRANQI